MAYGQKNYLEKQGINGKFRISQIGCFLTAFSNITERFGRPQDPVRLNAALRDKGIYIDVDDGIRDDLRWSSITKHDPNIVVTGTGSGAPPSNNAIVKFTGLRNNWGTHFSMVHDRKAGTIVDSWDGQIKSWNAYGGPKAWATYADKGHPKPAPQPQQKPATVPARHIQVQRGWGVSHAAKAYGFKDFGKEARWNAVAKLNGHDNYNNFKLSTGQIIRMEADTPVKDAPQPVDKTVENVISISARTGWGISYLLKAAGYSKDKYSSESEWLRFSKLNGAPDGRMMKIHPGREYKVYKEPAHTAKPVEVKKEAPTQKPEPKTEDNPEVTITTTSSPESQTITVDPKDPANTYVGPLKESDEEMFDLNAAKEARIMMKELTSYESLVLRPVGFIQGLWEKILIAFKIKRSK